MKFLLILVFLLSVAACVILLRQRSRTTLRLLEQNAEIRTLLHGNNAMAASVSRWGVFKHVEHLLSVNVGILTALKEKRVEDDPAARNLLGFVVLGTGYIPRGAGESPEKFLPEGASLAELHKMERSVSDQLNTLGSEELESDGVILNHPRFGGLTATEWLRFAEVHTEHHLKIAREILRCTS